MTNRTNKDTADNQDIVDLIDRRAAAAETTKVLLGSSGNGGLDVYDAALALIDLRLAELAD